MAMNTSKCNHLMPLCFKGLIYSVLLKTSYLHYSIISSCLLAYCSTYVFIYVDHLVQQQLSSSCCSGH